MTKRKNFFKFDIVGAIITVYSIVISAIALISESLLMEKLLAISYGLLIIVFLLLRLVFIKYDFSILTVLGFIILPMTVFLLGSRIPTIEEISLMIPVCLGILMGVLTFVRRTKDIKEYKVAIAAVSIFWILSFINGADFIEVTFDGGDVKPVNVEIQEKAYSVSRSEYSFYVYGNLDGRKNLPINVTFEQYKKLKIGDLIKINVGKGLLNRGYYYYVDNPVSTSKFHFWVYDDGSDEFLAYLDNEKLTYEVEQ